MSAHGFPRTRGLTWRGVLADIALGTVESVIDDVKLRVATVLVRWGYAIAMWL